MPDLAGSLDQREPKPKGVLRIPGPQDYELGLKAEEIAGESQQFDKSRGEVEPSSAASKALVNQHNRDTFSERTRPTTSGRRFGAGRNIAELEDGPTDAAAKPPTSKPSLTRRIFNRLVGKPEPVSKKPNTSKRDKAPIAKQAYQVNQVVINHNIVNDAPTSAPSNQSSVDIRARMVRSSEVLLYCNDTKTRQEQDTANIGGAFPPIDLRRRASYPESLDLVENSEEVCIVTHNLQLPILMLDRVRQYQSRLLQILQLGSQILRLLEQVLKLAMLSIFHWIVQRSQAILPSLIVIRRDSPVRGGDTTSSTIADSSVAS